MSGDIHRLEGSNSQMQGGLIIKKKKSNDDDNFVQPKLPHTEKRSVLGLDRLAATKAQEAKELVKFKERSRDEDRKKKYRESKEETPTWTGGVSSEAKRRKEERREKYRDSNSSFYSSNKDRDRDRDRDRYVICKRIVKISCFNKALVRLLFNQTLTIHKFIFCCI